MFGIAIALLVALVETEWPRFLALAPLLEAWLGRGVLQAGALRGRERGREGVGLESREIAGTFAGSVLLLFLLLLLLLAAFGSQAAAGSRAAALLGLRCSI